MDLFAQVFMGLFYVSFLVATLMDCYKTLKYGY